MQDLVLYNLVKISRDIKTVTHTKSSFEEYVLHDSEKKIIFQILSNTNFVQQKTRKQTETRKNQRKGTKENAEE